MTLEQSKVLPLSWEMYVSKKYTEPPVPAGWEPWADDRRDVLKALKW